MFYLKNSKLPVDFEPNYHVNYSVFEREKNVKKSDITLRIIRAVTPILSLYSPCRTAVLLQSSLIDTSKIIRDLSSEKGSGKKIRNLARLVLTVGFATLQIFSSTKASLIGEGVRIAENTFYLGKACYKLEIKQVGLSTLSIARSSIYIFSITIATPELIAISLIAQGAFEFYQAWQESKEGLWIEAVSDFTLGLFRCIQSGPYFAQSYENVMHTYDQFESDRFNQFSAFKVKEPGAEFNFYIKAKKLISENFVYKVIGFNNDLYGEEMQETSYGFKGLWVKNSDQTSHLFYTHKYYNNDTYLLSGVKAWHRSRLNWTEYFKRDISSLANITFNDSEGTCTHERLGKGTWNLSNSSRGGVELLVNFGQSDPLQWQRTVNEIQVDPYPVRQGSEMPWLRHFLDYSPKLFSQF